MTIPDRVETAHLLLDPGESFAHHWSSHGLVVPVLTETFPVHCSTSILDH